MNNNSNLMTHILTTLTNKISVFFKLNIIALRLNYQYKYNIYLLIFILTCIISSIILRSNLFIIHSLNVATIFSNYYNVFISILTLLCTLYSLKLIFDIMVRFIQAFKIIPEFIKMYNNEMKNIKSIISLYYIQNIFFILLSCWILFNIFIKLNTFIDGIYLFIIGLGIISSLVFIYYYPLTSFNFNVNIKIYPIWVYLLFFTFILFYMLILPLLIMNIIHSDKFHFFKQNDQYLDLCKHVNYMDNYNNKNITVNTQDLLFPHSSSSSAPSITGVNYNDLNYLSNVLDLKKAIRLDIINTNHYYLDLLHKNNIITKYSGFLERKGRLVLEYNIDKILKSRIEKGQIIFEDKNNSNNNNNNNTIINNIVTAAGDTILGTIRSIVNHIKIFTFIKNDFINYNRYLISNDNINIKNYDTIIISLKHDSFWKNYDYIKRLYILKFIDKTYFNKFIIKLINESVYQSNDNKFLIDDINYLSNNDIITFENKISNKFIYLNGSYSNRLIKSNNKHIFNLDYSAYYWEGVLNSLEKELHYLQQHKNINSERLDILKDLYYKFKHMNNYPGIKSINENNIIIPLRREQIFNAKFNIQNSSYELNFKNQTNNTFYYLYNLKAFIFKFNNKPIWIDCNNKVNLSHFIKDLDTKLKVKVKALILDSELLKNENLNFTNKNNYEIINDIISFANKNPNNIINLNKEYKIRLTRINNYLKQIIAMERALKLTIPNLDTTLIQNQNNIQLIPDIDYIKTNPKFTTFPEKTYSIYDTKRNKLLLNKNNIKKFNLYDFETLDFPINDKINKRFKDKF